MKNLLKFASIRRIASAVAGVAMVGMLVGGNVGTAFADTPTPVATSPTLTINGTSAAMDAPTVTIGGGGTITINGTDQSIGITMPVTVTDFSGTGSGWNVTLQATAFTTTSGGTSHLLKNTPMITNTPGVVDATPTTGTPGTYSNPVDSTPAKVVAPGTTPISIVGADVVLANATTGTGMGKFTINPTINLPIQSNDFASLNGNPYSSTFTVTFTDAPHS